MHYASEMVFSLCIWYLTGLQYFVYIYFKYKHLGVYKYVCLGKVACGYEGETALDLSGL